MVAYSFKSSFAAEILSGRKVQTIRRPRKRHARVGEELQLYTAMRTVHCKLIGRAICSAVRDVRLDFVEQTVTLDDSLVIDAPAALDAFAVSDGFTSRHVAAWAYMARWWATTHPDQPVFRGVLIAWERLL